MKPLTNRLQTALDLLPPCECIADVGCDHGLLTLALLLQGKCNHVLASDLSAPSLLKAKVRLERANLAHRASFDCCDGLAHARSAQAAAILGMGGHTIVQILRAGEKTARHMRCLVVQPAGHSRAVYEALPSLGLCVEEETIVREKGRFFPLIRLVPGIQTPLCGAAAELGPVNSARKDQTTLAYARWLCSVLEKTLRVHTGALSQQQAEDRLHILREYLEEQ